MRKVNCEYKEFSELVGLQLTPEYTLGRQIDSGGFGTIFNIKGQDLVAKFSLHTDSLANEIRAL